MMCKISSILLVVATVVVLAAGDCMQKIGDIAGKTKDRPLKGGYKLIKDPENDAVVKKIVADGIKAHHERSKDMVQCIDDGHYVAYSQLVNGDNYCCQFQMKSKGCKKGANSKGCQEKATYVCTVEAYKDFKATYANIEPDSVECTPVVRR